MSKLSLRRTKKPAKVEEQVVAPEATVAPEAVVAEAAPVAEAVPATEATPAEGKAKRSKPELTKAYHDHKGFGDEAKITWIAPDSGKKKRDSKRRFDLYREGMTVGEYVAVCTENKYSPVLGKDRTTPDKLARMDVRWDFVHGLIQVDGQTYSKSE